MRHSYRHWHRRAGVTSAVFVLLLSITGLLLLLEGPLGLRGKMLGGPLVSRAYDLAPDSPPVGILAGDTWAVMVDGFIYVGQGAPIPLAPPLITARLEGDGSLAISNPETTLYMTAAGQLIERASGGASGPSQAAALPVDIEAKILRRYSGRGLPASRVILDIHTGRFLGPIGPWLMGLAAILLCLLSVSGLILWARPLVRSVSRRRD
ncbi:MAG: PepSY-associated TM helix domain-containing protein [Robiginitomaculum sp.]